MHYNMYSKFINIHYKYDLYKELHTKRYHCVLLVFTEILHDMIDMLYCISHI